MPVSRYAMTNRLTVIVILLLLLLGGSLPASAQGSALSFHPEPFRDEENLLDNGRFRDVDEDGLPAAWSAVDARGSHDPEQLWEHMPSGRLQRAERGEGYWVQDVEAELEPGGRYVLSGWVRGQPGSVAFLGVQAAERREGGAQRIFRGLSRDEWQPVSMEFTAPASGRVRVWLGADFSGTVWWSGAFLGRAEDLPERLARVWEARLRRYDRVFTGLIVDARGLNLQRGMSPRIVDSDGNLLYAGIGADFDWLIRRGIVSYMKDLPAALNHPRLAAHEHYPYRLPMIVQGMSRVEDGFGASVVVRTHDADVVRRHLERYDFLARFAVVFLID